MKRFEISPIEMVASLWRHRDLARQMIYREVMGRYRGSILGIVWSLFNPVLMLSVYTFVFSIIFKARWQTSSNDQTEFAVVLFAGMIVFGIFSECITRSPGLILSNPNYVKKVVFPLEIMPWVLLGSALFHALVSLAVLLVFSLIVNHRIPWTAVYFPIVLLPLGGLILGLGWLLGALGVYLRDIGQTIGVMTTAIMFLSPVFYSVDALPEGIRHYAALNPLAFIIESAREVLIWGRQPDMGLLCLHLVVSIFVASLGFAWFQKTRAGFGDVL